MKILIVDDHRLFCDGLRHILVGLDDGPEILEAPRAADALDIIDTRPDLSLVLLDIGMPDMDGYTVLATISVQHPSLPVVMLTASENARDMRRAFDAGASGYIPKSSSAEVMIHALRLVLSGGVYVPPLLAGIHGREVCNADGGTAEKNGSAPLDGLTVRQMQVLQHLQGGLSNKEIAARLGVSEATVKVHMSAILRALGVHSRTEAALQAKHILDEAR
ncbi:MAG: response regulator transcription factor [Gammaproteobacteria bacterium]|jgi:DNA-binding NarL/FixJ family response regulator